MPTENGKQVANPQTCSDSGHCSGSGVPGLTLEPHAAQSADSKLLTRRTTGIPQVLEQRRRHVPDNITASCQTAHTYMAHAQLGWLLARHDSAAAARCMCVSQEGRHQCLLLKRRALGLDTARLGTVQITPKKALYIHARDQPWYAGAKVCDANVWYKSVISPPSTTDCEAGSYEVNCISTATQCCTGVS